MLPPQNKGKQLEKDLFFYYLIYMEMEFLFEYLQIENQLFSIFNPTIKQIKLTLMSKNDNKSKLKYWFIYLDDLKVDGHVSKKK